MAKLQESDDNKTEVNRMLVEINFLEEWYRRSVFEDLEKAVDRMLEFCNEHENQWVIKRR